MREIISQEKANEIVSAIEMALQPVVDAGHWTKAKNLITLRGSGSVKCMRVGYRLNLCDEEKAVNRDVLAFPSRWVAGCHSHEEQRRRAIELLYGNMNYWNNRGSATEPLDTLAYCTYITHWQEEIKHLMRAEMWALEWARRAISCGQ